MPERLKFVTERSLWYFACERREVVGFKTIQEAQEALVEVTRKAKEKAPGVGGWRARRRSFSSEIEQRKNPDLNSRRTLRLHTKPMPLFALKFRLLQQLLPIPFSGTPSAEIHLLLDCRISWEKHVYRRLSLCLYPPLSLWLLLFPRLFPSPNFKFQHIRNTSLSRFSFFPCPFFPPSHWLSFFLSFFLSFVLLSFSSILHLHPRSIQNPDWASSKNKTQTHKHTYEREHATRTTISSYRLLKTAITFTFALFCWIPYLNYLTPQAKKRYRRENRKHSTARERERERERREEKRREHCSWRRRSSSNNSTKPWSHSKERWAKSTSTSTTRSSEPYFIRCTENGPFWGNNGVS